MYLLTNIFVLTIFLPRRRRRRRRSFCACGASTVLQTYRREDERKQKETLQPQTPDGNILRHLRVQPRVSDITLGADTGAKLGLLLLKCIYRFIFTHWRRCGKLTVFNASNVTSALKSSTDRRHSRQNIKPNRYYFKAAEE